MSAPPIFIVGSPRSGTNLLCRMLDRHPNIAVCGETHLLSMVWPRRQAFGDPADPARRAKLVDALLATQRIQLLRFDSAKLAQRLNREGVSYPALFTALLQYYAAFEAKPRWGEKTPQHAFFSELLCEWYPGAVILHLVRDPRDVVASLQRMPFGFTSAILNARTWLKCNQAARESRHRPGYLEVRYESLVLQPDRELETICKHIGEDFSPRMLEAEQPASVAALEADRYLAPLTTERLGKWREQLTSDQAAQVEWTLGAELENFGYRREAPRASASLAARGLAAAAFDLARQAIPKLPALWYRFTAPADLRRYEYWRHPHLGTYTRPEAAPHPERAG